MSIVPVKCAQLFTLSPSEIHDTFFFCADPAFSARNAEQNEEQETKKLEAKIARGPSVIKQTPKNE
jgi:hypothetical protein